MVLISLFTSCYVHAIVFIGNFSKTDCATQLIKLKSIFSENPNAKGLAIVIGASDATGTIADVKNMKSAFKALNFVVYAEKTATRDEICKIVQAATEYSDYEPSCKCFAFYYAGHGGSDDGHSYILPYTIDDTEEKLYIKEGIVDFFSPENNPRLGKNPAQDRYRLFFFDCCLSDQDSRDVSKKRSLGNLPAGANMLVAYATSMKYKSKGSAGLGGTWTSVLHKNLLQDLSITTILDITCDEVINKGIIDKYNQAPHYISSVGILCLKCK